jgi:antitoxin component YwqK of YwqJK toxin-antitoxin module
MKVFLIALFTVFSLGIFAQENKLDANGKKDGPWKGYFEESKRVKYEGTFDHGKETGIFTFYDDTKVHSVVATRDFTKGNNSAYTIFFDPKKNKVSEGNIVNRQYEGEWKYYHEASSKIMTTENYKGGKLDGKRTVYYVSGKIAEEANYTAGTQNGPYKKYAENGTVLEEINYKKGQPDGIAIYRNPDNTIASKGPYVDGLKKGVWEFYEDGKLKKKEKYPLKAKFAKKVVKREN